MYCVNPSTDGDRMDEDWNESFSTIRALLPLLLTVITFEQASYAPSNTDRVKHDILLEFSPECDDCQRLFYYFIILLRVIK